MSTERLPLSPRELEVLAHVEAGHTLEQTAAAMGCSVGTVKKHRSNIRYKAGGGDLGQAWLLRLARRYRNRLPRAGGRS